LLSTRRSAGSRFALSQIRPHSPALDFPSSRAGDGSALRSSTTGFTGFACPAVPLSGEGCLPCPSHELLKVLVLLDVWPFPAGRRLAGNMASADPCRLNLASWPGLPSLRHSGRSPQVRALTFPAHLPHLLLRPLTALGFVVTCQLARPHSLRWSSCPSGHRFASGFLQTPPHGDALAFN